MELASLARTACHALTTAAADLVAILSRVQIAALVEPVHPAAPLPLVGSASKQGDMERFASTIVNIHTIRTVL
jgi:hypothetical protein